MELVRRNLEGFQAFKEPQDGLLLCVLGTYTTISDEGEGGGKSMYQNIERTWTVDKAIDEVSDILEGCKKMVESCGWLKWIYSEILAFEKVKVVGQIIKKNDSYYWLVIETNLGLFRVPYEFVTPYSRFKYETVDNALKMRDNALAIVSNADHILGDVFGHSVPFNREGL